MSRPSLAGGEGGSGSTGYYFSPAGKIAVIIAATTSRPCRARSGGRRGRRAAGHLRGG